MECGAVAKVYDTEKVTMVMDHFAPNKDIKAAVQCKMCRDFCNEQSVTHFYDVGRMGIEKVYIDLDVEIGKEYYYTVESFSLLTFSEFFAKMTLRLFIVD